MTDEQRVLVSDMVDLCPSLLWVLSLMKMIKYCQDECHSLSFDNLRLKQILLVFRMKNAKTKIQLENK